jgi:hypothetical protein
MIRNIAPRGGARARCAAAVAGLLLISLATAAPAARVATLLVLQYDVDGRTVQTPIPAQGGFVVAPAQGRPVPKWNIGPGDTIRSDAPPADRVVGFYQGPDAARQLLFIIEVHYFRNGDGGWVPQFQLDEEPLVARVNGQWQPLSTNKGVASLIVQTGTALPNAEGYTTALEFSFTTGPTSIDGWLVE